MTPPSAVLLDTDVFSVLFRGGPAAVGYRRVLVGSQVLISVFTQAEVLAGAELRGWGAGRLARLEEALASVITLELSDGVVRRYANVVAVATRTGHPLQGATQVVDRWIAASALEYEVPLLTGNRRHFDSLPGLTVLDVP